MKPNLRGNISECQNALLDKGFCQLKVKLPPLVRQFIKQKDYYQLDKLFTNLTSQNGDIFNILSNFIVFDYIEFIISLREAHNDWEEDGIWHDDGSRALAFTLSLTTEPIEGGVLGFRKKGEDEFKKIPTPEYSTLTIFKTGRDNFEHKIHKVTKGSRLIIAGWCYDSSSESIL